MKSRVLGLVLPDVFSTPSRMPSMPCMPCSSSVVSGSSMPLAPKSKFSSFREQRQRVDLQRQLFDQRHLVFGFGLGRAADRRRQVAEEHLVGIAAGFRGFVADRLIALLGVGQIARRGEDHFAPSAGKALAAAAGAGLDDDGMALRRARHRERPARLEELPVVVEPLHLGRIGEAAALLVDDQRAVFPGIPVAEHDFHELVGAVVAQVVLEMRVLAHVEGFAVVDRGHHVPGRRGRPSSGRGWRSGARRRTARNRWSSRSRRGRAFR